MLSALEDIRVERKVAHQNQAQKHCVALIGCGNAQRKWLKTEYRSEGQATVP